MKDGAVSKLLVAAWLYASAAAQAGSYQLVDIGVPDGGINSYATGINHDGVVVGFYSTSSVTQIAYSYSAGVMSDLGTLGGAASSATAINRHGRIVGFAETIHGVIHAYSFRGEALKDLAPHDEGQEMAAWGLNGRGEVVGAKGLSSPSMAFVHRQGTLTELGTLGGSSSVAAGINDNGQIVGSSSTAGDSESHAFAYQNGAMIDLGTLGGLYSAAVGINASGQITGYSFTADESIHPFLYTGGIMQDLGLLPGHHSCMAWALNDRGDVVGQCYSSLGASHAFIHHKGRLRNLNHLVEDAEAKGWQLETAAAINNAGQIVGWGQHKGNTRAFLLIPVAP